MRRAAAARVNRPDPRCRSVAGVLISASAAPAANSNENMGGRKKMAGTCAGHPDQTSLPLLSGIGSVRREAPGGWGAENSEASPWTEPRGNSASIAMHWGGTLSVPGPAQGCIWAEARFLHGRRLRVPTLPAAQAVAACSAIQHPRMHGGRSRACATMTSRTGRPATLRPVAQNFGGRRRDRLASIMALSPLQQRTVRP